MPFTKAKLHQPLFATLFILLCFDVYAQQPILSLDMNFNAKDISGNNNNGNMNGSLKPTRDRFNNPCGAMYFDGRTSYIEIPTSPSLESIDNAFTFVAWYKIDKISDNQWLTFFCKGQTVAQTKTNPSYRFQVTQNPNSVSNSCDVGVQQNGFSTISINEEFTRCDYNFRDHLFEVGKWCSYVITYDGQTITAYSNNKKVYSQTYNGRMLRNNLPLFIGLDEPGSIEYFEGALDDIRIYNVALSESSLTALYNETGKTFPDDDLMPIPTKHINLPENSCSQSANFSLPVISSNCNNQLIRQVQGPQPGTQVSKGVHKIVFELSENDYVQQSTFYLDVRDVSPPKFKSLIRDTTIYIDASAKASNFIYKLPDATDNCDIRNVSTTAGPQSGDALAPGKYTVRYEAVDKSDNSTQQAFIVNIVKRDPPPVAKKDSSQITPTNPVVIVPPAAPEIKTTPPVSVPPKKDSTIAKPVIVAPVPVPKKIIEEDPSNKPILELVTKRRKDIQYELEVDSPQIRIDIYDNGLIDDDTVTVLFNNRLIVKNGRISTKALSFIVDIDPDKDNEITIFADNLGSIPPNTSLLVITDGKKRHELNMSSGLITNGTIVIRKKKQSTP
jgi:hypothetical protein